MNKIDWSKAPNDAEFYSRCGFRKQDLFGREFVAVGDLWVQCKRNHLDKHKKAKDYQQRPKEKQMSHYKGQMTKEQLLNTKIRILSPDHSEAFQKMCFDAGGKWVSGREVISSGVRFIFIRYHCGLGLKHSTSEDNFLNSDCTEITWEPEMSTTTTTKKPKASLRIQSSNGRYSERTLDNIAMMGDNVKYWLAWLCGENVERLVNESWHKPAMPSFDSSETYRFAPDKEEQTDYDKIEASKELLKKYGIIIEGYTFDKETVIVNTKGTNKLIGSKQLLKVIDDIKSKDHQLSAIFSEYE